MNQFHRLGSIGFVLAVGMLALWLTSSVMAAPDAIQFSIDFLDENGPIGGAVDSGTVVTQSIAFTRTQGSGTNPFQIRYPVPDGFSSAGKIVVQTQNASPAEVRIKNRVIGWQGEMQTNGRLRILIPMRVVCGDPTNPECIGIVAATLSDSGGNETSAQTSLTIKNAFDPSLVSATAGVLVGDEVLTEIGSCTAGCDPTQVTLTNSNSDPVNVVVRITSGSGLQPQSLETTVESSTRATAQSGDQVSYKSVTLPGVGKATLDINFKAKSLTTAEVGLAYFLYPAGGERPDSLPPEEDWTEIGSVTYTQNRYDFGDAPDSTNRLNSPMSAYDGVSGNFPTDLVSNGDGSTGPYHQNPKIFFLGRGVSVETAAEGGKDQDRVSNLDLTAGLSDQDRFDDGFQLSKFAPVACESVPVTVRGFISQEAFDYFQNSSEDGLAYLNIWLDQNRDGDWDDSYSVCDGGAGESDHVLSNQILKPVELGMLWFEIQFMLSSQLIDGDLDKWMRVTLSEQPVELINGMSDGRGVEGGFLMGETEDYFLIDPNGELAGPQLGLDIQQVPVDETDTYDLDTRAVDANFRRKFDAKFTFLIRNFGNEPAEDIDLRFDVPDLSAVGIKVGGDIPGTNWTGCLTCVRSIDAVSGPMETTAPEVFVHISALQPESFARVTVGFRCQSDNCPSGDNLVRPEVTYSALGLSPKIVPFDINPTQRDPLITLNPNGWTGCLTCVRSIDAPLQATVPALFEIQAPSNSTLEYFGNGQSLGFNDNDFYRFVCEKLGIDCCEYFNIDCGEIFTDFKAAETIALSVASVDGDGNVGPRSNELELTCDGTMIQGSLTFIDSAGNQFRVPQGITLDNGLKQLKFLKPGETYTVGLYYCGEDSSPEIVLSGGGQSVTLSNAETQYGFMYIGEWPVVASRSGSQTDSSLSLSITADGTTSEQEYTVSSDVEGGIITDGATGSPIDGATVDILVEQSATVGDESGFVTYESIGSVETGSDGGYLAGVEPGRYQLLVSKEGYQTYRSETIEITESGLGTDISLNQAVSGAVDHTVLIDSIGYIEAALTVNAGDVVEFVNVDTELRGVSGTGFNSGLLNTNESWRVTFDTEGTYSFSDPADSGNGGQITVSGSQSFDVYLPFMR